MHCEELQHLREKCKVSLLAQFYRHVTEEIRFSKRLQMTSTYYAILLYGGIITLHKSWPSGLRSSILSIFLLIMGITFLRTCELSLQNNREWLDFVNYNYFCLYCRMETALKRNNKLQETYSKEIFSTYYWIHVVACIITIVITVLWKS